MVCGLLVKAWSKLESPSLEDDSGLQVKVKRR